MPALLILTFIAIGAAVVFKVFIMVILVLFLGLLVSAAASMLLHAK
jgi:hypothetical protein